MDSFVDSRQYLACHQEILRLACQMHRAALQSDWDLLTELQAPYIREVERLKGDKANVQLSASEREYRYEMLKAILSEDAAIRNLLMPAFERVSAMLINGRRRQGLARAYCTAD